MLQATILHLLVFFAEPNFPTADVHSLSSIPSGAVVAQSVEDLRTALKPGRILIWRHGSAFPAEAWPDILAFLEDGGSLVYLGGEPFTRPAIGPPGKRILQARSVSMLKELNLNQCYGQSVASLSLRFVSEQNKYLPAEKLPKDSSVYVLEPRLADTKDFADEDGAPGARDAIVRPLSHIIDPGNPAYPVAAGSIVMDRLRGRFAGGHWVFRLVSTKATENELQSLYEIAQQRVVDFRLDPSFGCFHEGEQPSLIARLHFPLAKGVEEHEFNLSVTGPDGSSWSLPRQSIQCGKHGSLRIAIPKATAPGLYRVLASGPNLPRVETGFWIFDEELFASGDVLSFDNYTMLRNGQPEPVLGTTIMSNTVHRKFLFEPNAAVWDDSFRELSELNINLVRTGIWSAYRKISLDPNSIDEAWLRALEAYYLSARRHGIPIIFTFFAFIPDSFGGVSPYFDPRSIEAQQAWLSAVATRFVKAKEIMWDFINEPSFANPKKLWICRPNGDPHEKKAFLAWLEKRYSPKGMSAGSWQDEVRKRWRLLPGDSIGVPSEGDFVARQVMEDYRPYRAQDYVLFAQYAFGEWVRKMTTALRSVGSKVPITVGQDEGGTMQRPSPLFHHEVIDFTSVHSWWFNDHLVWDGLLARAKGKPLLVGETGIMKREKLSGESIRSAQGSADLLARKIGAAFASGAFGLVEWCYDVNPYMASDNEVAIGLRRVDGSYKPEHAVMRKFASFLKRNRFRFSNPKEPEVVLLLPSSDHYSPRAMQAAATQRIVDILLRELGIAVQVVSEYRAEQDLGQPKLIILPSCPGISNEAWTSLTKAVEAGAVVHCSGFFEADDVGYPAKRIGQSARALAQFENFKLNSKETMLHYPKEIFESWMTSSSNQLSETKLGKGQILHYSQPIDVADHNPIQRECYEYSIQKAGINAFKSPPGVLVRQLEFAKAKLVVVINDSSRDSSVNEVKVPAGHAVMFFEDANGQVLDSSNSKAF